MGIRSRFTSYLDRKWDSRILLQNRDFFRLWLASGLWGQAMWMEQLVLGWVALELTNSAWWVALIGFYRYCPLLLIGPFSAAITDRFKRRSLIVVLQLSNGMGIGLLAALMGLGVLEYWHIALVSLILGACWALDWPTRRALIPDLVGKERVVDAMVLENLFQGLTRFTGPLGAGTLLALVGMLGALVVLAVLGMASTLILLGMKTDARAPSAPRGMLDFWQSARAGLGYVRRQPRILGAVLTTVLMNVWVFPYMTLLPVFARDVLHQGPFGLGLLGAVHGIGTFVGLVVVNSARNFWSKEWLFAGGAVLTCLGIAGFASSTSFLFSLLLLMVAGLGHASFSSMQSSIILLEASDEMRGRAMGALVLAIGLGPLGRLQSGAMAAAWGAPLAVGSMAALAVLGILVVVFMVPDFIGGLKPAEGGEQRLAALLRGRRSRA